MAGAEMKKKAARSKDKRKEPGHSSKVRPARDGPEPSRLRKWAFRLLAAVLAPVLFLAIAELGLRLFGYGYQTSYFIKAQEADTYLSNPKFGWRFFGPTLSRTPIPTCLSADKPENTYRILVFGGSAAYGTPNPAFSFSRILEAMLNDRYGPTRFEVINTGMTAINSHVVLQIARDCATFEPDLFIVYLGNNEVVGPYGAGTVFNGFNPSLRAIRASIRLRSSRVGQLLGDAVRALASQTDDREQWGGLEMFLGNQVAADDPRLASVYDNFRANLNDLCAAGRRAGAKVILSTVVTNLRDFPPFASLHRPGLSAADKTRWEDLYADGEKLQGAGDHEQAVGSYVAAAAIDDQFAELHFRLARCLLALGQPDRAREHFIRARDLDALRFRADSRINRIIREVASGREAEGVHLVDAERALVGDARTAAGVPGERLLHEHVHLTFEGSYAVATSIFKKAAHLLPRALRRSATQDAGPPSLERCAELVMFTPYDRCAVELLMADMLSKPPFSKQQHAEALARHDQLRAKLTPPVFRQIVAKYRQALTRRPDDLLMRHNFMGLLFGLGRHEDAAEQLREMLRRYPHSVDWHSSLGRILAGQGRLDQAIEQFNKALSIQPGDLKVRKALEEARDRRRKADADRKAPPARGGNGP